MPTRELDVVADVPDLRDLLYQPRLDPLPPQVHPPGNLTILDQGQEGACTGFGLAAVVNLLLANQSRDQTVSPRMLYAMAQRFDEWPGEDYSGSSCRGAIRGWHYNGVCPASDWPYKPDQPGILTLARARAARAITPGAYYRVSPRVSDYHAALNETGVLFASARVHTGWNNPRNGVITPGGKATGGHAFAVVGYDDDGFWIQNSWGVDWGRAGLAHWAYADWRDSVMDAWVVQLARPTPDIFPGYAAEAMREKGSLAPQRTPTRLEIAGHFVHLDDGRFDDCGKYFSNIDDVRQTASVLETSVDYDHLLLYAHGGLNDVEASACRIRDMKEIYKANRIYPYHFMWDTGLFEELKDVIFGVRSRASQRVEGFSDFSDVLIEKFASKLGTLVWDEMKHDAQRPFDGRSADGTRTVRELVRAAGRNPHRIKVHLAGHSAGAIFMNRLIDAIPRIDKQMRVETLTLWAPADRHDAFAKRVIPRIGATKAVKNLRIAVLADDLERDDTVTPAYRKSLLYLVSRAFEGSNPGKILGMERYVDELPAALRKRVFVSKGVDDGKAVTASRTHGGFDNDPLSLNRLLEDILGKAPTRPFRKGDVSA
ncbi:MAG TPA: C1 family peptidase [Pseudomonadales bacterium]|nr:C1 family peptidase [Pseudomonadales bacterium]